MDRKKITNEELGRLSVEDFKKSEKIPVTIILDNIRSHHNVGSVFRSCDAFLIEKIYLCGITPIPPHRDIHKTALGATETVNWQHYKYTMKVVEKLKPKKHIKKTAFSTHIPYKMLSITC